MEATFGEDMTDRFWGGPASPAFLRPLTPQNPHLRSQGIVKVSVMYVVLHVHLLLRVYFILVTSYALVLVTPSWAAMMRASTSAPSEPLVSHQWVATLSVDGLTIFLRSIAF